MRIVHIAAGAGSMYCGACARDLSLVKGLMSRGHDVEIVPLYTPLRMDTDEVPETAPVFYGGINVFLQQSSPLFRKLPKFMDRWLDNDRFLRAVSNFAINTSPRDLGPMTVSVLAGKDGMQSKELDRLLDYLESAPRPDLISITNSMLSAIAPEVKRRLKVPVVCALQGEEGFIEAMPQKYAARARELMQNNIRHIDRLIAPSEAYAQKMREYLKVDPDKIAVVPVGIDTDLYKRNVPRVHSPFTIGYLSVISRQKGLDLLVEAFGTGIGDARLLVAGRVLDKQYWENIQKRVNELGILDKFQYLGEVDLKGKLDILDNCSAFVLPTRIHESRGVAVMEAMSKGLPVVVPGHGIFNELVEPHNAGILVGSDDIMGLRNALTELIADADRAENLASNAANVIRERYNIDIVSETALKVYMDAIAL